MKTKLHDILRALIELLDIPPSYYEKAAARHQSLGEWFHRPESGIAKYDPAVYPQGSFRLGTVIRPLLDCDEYDLDVVCQLLGLKKTELTQKELKRLVGVEVKSYREAKGIKEPVIERKRCWRLDYADEVKFHIDTLPSIPEDRSVIVFLVQLGVEPYLAASAIALTCKTHEHYEVISSNWPTSNPHGFARWFEEKMGREAESQRRELTAKRVYASIEQVPTYALKTTLQRSVQLFKRHRDVMFKNDPDGKPISMILTTLAAHAYEGEDDLGQAVQGILERMPNFVLQGERRVPNPVNPGEDFADKWRKDPSLEEKFWLWHRQASQDFAALGSIGDATQLRRRFLTKFGAELSEDRAKDLTGGSRGGPSIIVAPTISIPSAPKPWSRRDA